MSIGRWFALGKALVLVGAGASFGSKEVRPNRPPLGNMLFDELSMHCRKLNRVAGVSFCWGYLDDGWAVAFRADFETAMQRLKDEISEHQVVFLLNCMAEFFLQFQPTGSDGNYTKLFSSVLRSYPMADELAICSLNYEGVADEVLYKCGKQPRWFRDISDRVSDEEIRMFRPHGAANFVTDTRAGMPIGLSIDLGTGQFDEVGPLWSKVRHDFPLRFLPSQTAITYIEQARTESYAPAMALYMDSKPMLSGTSGISKIREAYSEYVQSVEIVIVVGARIVLRDQHIFGPILRNPDCRVFFVGADEVDGAPDTGVLEFKRVFGDRFVTIGKYFADIDFENPPWVTA